MRSLIIIWLLIPFFTIGVDSAISQNVPIPDLKLNGSDGPITMSTNDSLSVTVSLDTAGSSGTADWWIAVYTPFDWYYLDAYTGSWLPGLSFSYKGPLFNLPPVKISDISGLPPGTYTFYFAVDTNMNGQLDFDQLHYDDVVVNVTGAGSSLAGTWVVANFDSYISLILTEPNILSDTDYTWVNQCTESGTYTVSGSSITFDMHQTNCEEGRGLVGGASALSSVKQVKQDHETYVYSLIGKSLNIRNVRLGTQTIDLLMDFRDPSTLEKIGNGTIAVVRGEELGGCSRTAVGDIPFTIYRLPFGPHANHNEAYGFGDLTGELFCSLGTSPWHCTWRMVSKGTAEIRGYFAEIPPYDCMLGIAISDNNHWGQCTITELSGNYCGDLHMGWTTEPCIPPSPEWLEFPLIKGYVIHKDLYTSYTLKDIQLGPDTFCSFLPPGLE